MDKAMTIDLIPMDVEHLQEMFYLSGSELYRVGKPEKGLKEQKSVRCGSMGRIHTPRIIYALQEGVEPTGEVFLNDEGKYVNVDDRSLALMIRYRESDKVSVKHNGSYVARWFNDSGERKSKLFRTNEEAIGYQRKMLKKYWGDKLRSLGFDSMLLAGGSE